MKKRILALILGVLMIMSIAACGKTEKKTDGTPGTDNNTSGVDTIQIVSGVGQKEEYDSDTYDTLIKGLAPVVMLYYGDAGKYPELNEAFEDNYETANEEISVYFEENIDFAKELHMEHSESFIPFELSTIPLIRRADTLVTSVLFSRLEYAGGSRASYFYYGENYDTESGKAIGLYDIVRDKKLLYDAIFEQLNLFWGDIWSGDVSDIEKVMEDGSCFSWTLDYNGITFYFMPYSIISSAPGTQMVTVSNEEYPGIINEKFMAVPESYGVDIGNDTVFYYDITGDGKVDEIIFSAYVSDSGSPGCASIYINGKNFDTEEYFYNAKATFVHAKNGKNYMLVEFLTDNDYREIKVFELSDTAENIGSCDGGLRKTYHAGGEIITTQDVLTDPEGFYLQKTTQHLSTVTGHKKYSIGDNGIPESDEEYFMFDEESAPTFTLLQDIEAESYDEKNGTTGEKATLKEGSEVIYTGTDGERFALLSSDGGLYRVETIADNDEPFCKINGVGIDEIFEGIVYAG